MFLFLKYTKKFFIYMHKPKMITKMKREKYDLMVLLLIFARCSGGHYHFHSKLHRMWLKIHTVLDKWFNHIKYTIF